MKKIICFAGFPEGELPTLTAATATSNAPWECCFVADAPAALAAAGRQPLDALVANMTMPGMSGAELLRELRVTNPQTLGFIVGQVTEQADIASGTGGTHQFIRRPYKPAKLVDKLKRGLSLDAWLATDAIRKLAPQLRRLPSLPSTYFNLLKEMESDSATTQSIGAIIARDPVVTARLLQMVNSAAFALMQKVTDPIDAVALLGVETINSLVLGLQVFSQSDEAREAGISLELLWEHSLMVAKYARLITLKQTGDQRLAGDAFTAGLLHDVGRIVLASNLPKPYSAIIAQARETARPLHEEETAQLGVDHARVGAYLLGLWGLPVEIVEATAGHHAPGKAGFAAEFTLLAAVHAANVFAHATGGQTDGLVLPQLDQEYFRAAHLSEQLPGWREACTGEKPTPPPQPTPPPPPPGSPTRPPSAQLAPPASAPAPRLAISWVLVALAVLLLLGLGWLVIHSYSSRNAASTPSLATSPATNEVPVPSTPRPADQPAAATTLAVSKPTNAPPAAAAANPLDHVRLQGIFYRPAHPQAIINGYTVGIGDRIETMQVVEITQQSVTLQNNGERRSFQLK